MLRPRWTLTMAGDVSATPAVVNGVVYVPDWGGYISAIKASNGRVIWRRLISSYNGIAGSVSRSDPVLDGSTLVIGTQTGADIIAINTATGARKWITRADAHPAAQITGSAVIEQEIVVYDGRVLRRRASAENAQLPVLHLPRQRGGAQRVHRHGALEDLHGARQRRQARRLQRRGGLGLHAPAIDPATNSVCVGTGNSYLVPAAATAALRGERREEPHLRTRTAAHAADDYLSVLSALNLKNRQESTMGPTRSKVLDTSPCLGQQPAAVPASAGVPRRKRSGLRLRLRRRTWTTTRSPCRPGKGPA